MNFHSAARGILENAMNPRDLGLPANDRHIHEAVALCERNRGKLSEPAELRPRVIRLLQKRRHEDKDLLCLALVGGLPQMLDGLLKERFEPDFVSLVEASRKLQYDSYEGAAAAPDRIKLYSLALAVETLAGDQEFVSDISRYGRLAAETTGKTSDPGLEKLFSRKLEERRIRNLNGLKFKSFGEMKLLDAPIVRGAYDMLAAYCADGRIQRHNLEQASRTARALSERKSTAKPVTVALALVDLSIAGSRYYTDNAAIEQALGPEAGGIMKKNGTYRTHSAKDFTATHPDFRPVPVMAFVVNAEWRMKELKEFLAVNADRLKSSIAQRRMKYLQEAEETARKAVVPSAIAQADLRNLFTQTLEKLTAFNRQYDGSAPKGLLPPKAG
jgi:hypothetical protein